MFRIAMGRGCSSRPSISCFPGCAICSPTASTTAPICVTPLANSAIGRSRSSNAPRRLPAFICCPAAGLLNEPSRGSIQTAAWPRISRRRSPAPKRGSTSPLYSSSSGDWPNPPRNFPKTKYNYTDSDSDTKLNGRCRFSQRAFRGDVGQRARCADSGRSPDRKGTARLDPQETFLATPADRRVGQKAVIRVRQLDMPTAGSRQLIEQPTRFFQIGGIEAFGEPAVDRREQVTGFGAAALVAAKPGEAHGGAQLLFAATTSARNRDGTASASTPSCSKL